jgi:hypothetical protein
MKLKKSQIPLVTIPYETQKNKMQEDDSISLKFISKILKIFGENL